MTKNQLVAIGVTGLGGYAGQVVNLLTALGRQSDSTVRLAAVCEPDQVLHAARIAELRQAGVSVLSRFEDLLAQPMEVVWLPLPIDLHRPFTERALAAGKAVVCEKPAAGCVDDVDAMIVARDRARLPVAIGYQTIYDPATLSLKRRLLAGAIGQVQSASVWACWARGEQYYHRSPWAGALRRGPTWVLDSPANNALAHQINLLLFLLGDQLLEAARPADVEAELYRANPIENYDTVSMRITVEGGARILALLTHACREHRGPVLHLRGTRGQVTCDANQIVLQSPTENQTLARDPSPQKHIAPRLVKALRGQEDPEIALCTLEIARAQSVVISGASQAAAVHEVSSDHWREAPCSSGKARAITDIERIFTTCAVQGRMLHESGLAAWSVPPAGLSLRGYNHFVGLPAVK